MGDFSYITIPKVKKNLGRTEDFVIEGFRDIVCSGNMGTIAPIMTAKGTLF